MSESELVHITEHEFEGRAVPYALVCKSVEDDLARHVNHWLSTLGKALHAHLRLVTLDEESWRARELGVYDASVCPALVDTRSQARVWDVVDLPSLRAFLRRTAHVPEGALVLLPANSHQTPRPLPSPPAPAPMPRPAAAGRKRSKAPAEEQARPANVPSAEPKPAPPVSGADAAARAKGRAVGRTPPPVGGRSTKARSSAAPRVPEPASASQPARQLALFAPGRGDDGPRSATSKASAKKSPKVGKPSPPKKPGSRPRKK